MRDLLNNKDIINCEEKNVYRIKGIEANMVRGGIYKDVGLSFEEY